MDELKTKKLYVWGLEAFTTAIAFAHSEEEALGLVEKEYGKLNERQKKVNPRVITEPIAFVYYFD